MRHHEGVWRTESVSISNRFSICRYLADEEARALGHIVLRLPPYHCQYNPIELVWGIMKRHYDKHIGEYGDFTEEKCLRKWEDAMGKITPAVWKSAVEKIQRLIAEDYRREANDSMDKTDYGGLVLNVGMSSDEDEESDVDDTPMPEPSRRPVLAGKNVDAAAPCRRSLFPAVKRKKAGGLQSQKETSTISSFVLFSCFLVEGSRGGSRFHQSVYKIKSSLNYKSLQSFPVIPVFSSDQSL